MNALKIPAALVNFVRCGSIGSVGLVSVASVGFVSIVGASIIGLHGALRVGTGAGAGRRWVAVTRSGRRLLNQDTVSTTIGCNDGYHTTVFVRTTRALGTRRELRGELRAADRGDLGDECEYEGNECDSLHIPGRKQTNFRFRLHSLASR